MATSADPRDPSAAAVNAPAWLSEAQRHFRDHGWVVVRGFCSPEETAALSGWTEELVARPERRGAEMVYHETSLDTPTVRLLQRIENFCPYHEGFDRFVRGRLQRTV